MIKKPSAIYRSVLLDPRAPTRLRLSALESMSRPSLRLLTKIARCDKSPKVRLLAAKKMEIELTRRELRKNVEKGITKENA